MTERELIIRNIHGVQYPDLNDTDYQRWFMNIAPGSYWHSGVFMAPLENKGSTILTSSADEVHGYRHQKAIEYGHWSLFNRLNQIEDQRQKIPVWFLFDEEADVTATVVKVSRYQGYWLAAININGKADAVVVPPLDNEIRSRQEKIKLVQGLKPIGKFAVATQFIISGKQQSAMTITAAA